MEKYEEENEPMCEDQTENMQSVAEQADYDELNIYDLCGKDSEQVPFVVDSLLPQTVQSLPAFYPLQINGLEEETELELNPVINTHKHISNDQDGGRKRKQRNVSKIG